MDLFFKARNNFLLYVLIIVTYYFQNSPLESYYIILGHIVCCVYKESPM